MRVLLTQTFNLAIEPQVSFENCIYKCKLRFDAYNKQHGILFEYQGGQHYFPVDFDGIGKERAECQFKETQERDEIKRSFCKENGFTLIEIPYWEFPNMEEYLREKLSNIIA